LAISSPVRAQEAQAEPSAQDAPPDPEVAAAEQAEGEPFFDTVHVNVVNVDVRVTDKKGNPITGLTMDDFEIYEDKRLVPATNFYAVEGGVPVAGALEDLGTEELPTRSNDPMRLIPPNQRLNLIVYVDNFNIRPFNRNRVFRRLREFLQNQLSPGDRAMLVSYDRSLHVRHEFTTDPALIAHATFELEKLTGFAVHRDSDRRDLLREIEEAESMSEVRWRVKQYAESEYNDLSFTLTALTDFVDSLAGLEGRKAILYVSDGLEMTSAEDLYYALNFKFQESSVLGESRDYNAHRQFRTLTLKANENRVSFYTIDAAGLRVYSSATAEKATANPIAGMDTHVDSVHMSNLQGSLQFMAEETGGLAIINTNDIGDRLRTVANDFTSYYSLGYTPSHAGDGRYYPIKVKLKEKKKGYKLRHRTGYRDKNSSDRMVDGTTSSLVHNLASNPLELKILLGQGRQQDKHFMVPISVTVPLDQVVLVEQGGVYLGRVKLFFSAMDEKGDLSTVQEVPLRLRIPADKMEAMGGVEFRLVETELQMRRGGHRVAVGFLDEIGATESYVTREVVVGI
jgi:VWFA-related protein